MRQSTVRLVVLAVAGIALAGCMPTTRAPRDLPAATVPPGAVQVYAVGDIADCRRAPAAQAVARRTALLVPDGSIVLGLGDMAYPYADAATLASCFEPTWGRHRASLLPVPGNHDYVAGSAREFRRYFAVAAYAASDRFVAYARPLSPDWMLLALDSNVAGEAMRQQRAWLERTLERLRPSTPAGGEPGPRCIAVTWHTPLYSSGWHRGSGEHMRALWSVLDEHGVDLVLSGHEHFYEAFDPLDASGGRPHDGSGVRQFTVGTGGAHLYGFWRPPYGSRARVLDFGVLQLTLEPDRYAWRFIDVDGRVRDAGTATCRGWPRTAGSTGATN